jgi:hypothetical protein
MKRIEAERVRTSTGRKGCKKRNQLAMQGVEDPSEVKTPGLFHRS